MDLKDLMSGIAVVIDDALDQKSASKENRELPEDRISDIVNLFQQEWNIPFYRASTMPSDDIWANLLEFSSFVLLDWKLWPKGASNLEDYFVEKHLRFLQQAKACSVPVFIFTNEDTADIRYRLEEIYQGEALKKSFVFIQRKDELLSNGSLNLDKVREWVMENASVYALKKWDQLFRAARRSLFSSMYKGSPDWPRVFWRSYKEDDVDPGIALTEMINDSLRGRMQANAFNEGLPDALGAMSPEVTREQLRALIAATCFVDDPIGGEARCGDLFKRQGKYLLNIRPDCDCIARGDQVPEDVVLYCIEGTPISDKKLSGKYNKGQFVEGISDGIVFAVIRGRSIWFAFRRLRVVTYGDLKEQRVGRLLHPYLTRIQQRYALFLQRQALPPVPREAIFAEPPNDQ